MKIAYFVNEYPKVSHTFIRREILALERQGFDILRISLRGWDAQLPDAEDEAERAKTRFVLQGGVAALILPTLLSMIRHPLRFIAALRLAASTARASDRPFVYHLIYVAEACRMLPWLRAFGAVRMHAHFGDNSAEVVMLARALGGPPYSFTVHGPLEFFGNWGMAEKIHHCDFVVAISSFGRSQLFLRCDPRDWSKVSVIHCGLDRSFYSDVSAVPVPATEKIVCVGRLCESKGQLLLLEAVGRLIAGGTPIQLVLAGDGAMRPALEQRIAQLSLGSYVRITGWISGEQVRAEILAARALVLPSFGEGLPVVIMEAMALRRPVLSTYIAGIPELVRAGENGWLFPAGSIDEMERALRECLSMSTERLQQMGDSGFERVTGRHDIDVEAARLAELFRAPGSAVRQP